MSPPGAFEAREVVKPILYEGRPHRSILRSLPEERQQRNPFA